MFGLTGTLWQADRPCDLESIYGTEVPAGVQRDDPWPVLYVAVLRSHCCTLDVDVHRAMAQGGPPWNGGGEKKRDSYDGLTHAVFSFGLLLMTYTMSAV